MGGVINRRITMSLRELRNDSGFLKRKHFSAAARFFREFFFSRFFQIGTLPPFFR